MPLFPISGLKFDSNTGFNLLAVGSKLKSRLPIRAELNKILRTSGKLKGVLPLNVTKQFGCIFDPFQLG